MKKDANSLEEKVVVITGASSGIGRATALAVAAEGGTVVLASRQEKALEEVARLCKREGGQALVVPTDVTDERAMRMLARRAFETYGEVDVWVNNAAVSLFAKFEEAPPEAYRRVIETNLFGYVNGARAVLPYFREQGRGVLINVSSMVGRVGSPYVSAYATSKFAIAGWAESLRMELQDAPEIQVSTILAASIDTPLFQHAGNYTGKAVKPMEPVYTPEMVADAIIACIRKPRRELYVGKAGAGLAGMRTMMPRLAERMMAKQVEHDHFQDEAEDPKDGNVFQPMGAFNDVSGGWNGREPSGRTGAVLGAAVAVAVAGAAAFLFHRNSHRLEYAARRGRRAASPVRARRRGMIGVSSR